MCKTQYFPSGSKYVFQKKKKKRGFGSHSSGTFFFLIGIFFHFAPTSLTKEINKGRVVNESNRAE